MPKKSSPSKKAAPAMEMKLHFFMPAIGGFLVTWIFSESLMLSLKVGLVVLIFSYIGMWMSKNK